MCAKEGPDLEGFHRRIHLAVVCGLVWSGSQPEVGKMNVLKPMRGNGETAMGAKNRTCMLIAFALPPAIGNLHLLELSQIWGRALYEEGINIKLKEFCHLTFGSPTTPGKVVFFLELGSELINFYVLFTFYTWLLKSICASRD